MKAKNQIILIFYIFLILTSNSFSNICEELVINRYDYNLDLIKEGKADATIPHSISGVKQVQAFNYNYLIDNFEINTKKTLIDLFLMALKAEGEKIELYGLLDYAEKAFYSIGIDIRLNKIDYNNFLDSVQKEVYRDYGLDNNIKLYFSLAIEKAKHNFIEFKNHRYKNKNKIFLETTATAGSIGAGLLASHLIHIYCAIPLTISGPIGIFASLFTGTLFSKLWNKPLEKEIKEQVKMFEKLTALLDLIFFQLKNLEWLENNIIFTAISLIDDCNNCAVKYDFEDDIKYKNKVRVFKKMADRTCVLKRNECPNHKECVLNLMDHIECLSQKKRGLKNSCQAFNKEDCTLDKEEEKIYDL